MELCLSCINPPIWSCCFPFFNDLSLLVSKMQIHFYLSPYKFSVQRFMVLHMYSYRQLAPPWQCTADWPCESACQVDIDAQQVGVHHMAVGSEPGIPHISDLREHVHLAAQDDDVVHLKNGTECPHWSLEISMARAKDCGNSIALAMELTQSCAKSLKMSVMLQTFLISSYGWHILKFYCDFIWVSSLAP